MKEADLIQAGEVVQTRWLFAAGYGRGFRVCDLSRAVDEFKEKNVMTLDRAVMAFAGLVVLVSLSLGVLLSPWWLLLAGFAGLNMIQASFTGFCPAAMIFKSLGVKKGCAFE